jgi:hypothetical protein
MNLAEIDLSIGTDNDHPQLTTPDTIYLCLIGGCYRTGVFTKENNKLYFWDWLSETIQYQKPSSTSQWNKIYRIDETDDEAADRKRFRLNRPTWTKPTQSIARDGEGQLLYLFRRKR